MSCNASEVLPLPDHSLATEIQLLVTRVRCFNNILLYTVTASRYRVQTRAYRTVLTTESNTTRMHARGGAALHLLELAEICDRASRLRAGRPTARLPRVRRRVANRYVTLTHPEVTTVEPS